MFPDFVRNSGILASSASRRRQPNRAADDAPTETTPSCWVSRLKPSTAAVVFVDWSSATTRLSSRPPPRPFTPPDLLISFTASAAPARTWRPHGTKLAWSKRREHADLDRATPRAELEPPYALDPLNAATSIATAPTAAINTASRAPLLLSCLPTTGLPDLASGRSLRRRAELKGCANRGRSQRPASASRGHRRMYTTRRAASSSRRGAPYSPSVCIQAL